MDTTEMSEFRLENKRAFEEFRREMADLIRIQVLAEMQNLQISIKEAN